MEQQEGQLPARSERERSSLPISISRGVWGVPEAALREALAAPPLEPEEIVVRWRALRGLYMTRSLAPEERQAVLAVWVRVLGELPGPFVDAAIERWCREEERMPAPAGIARLVRELMDEARSACRPSIRAATPEEVAARLPQPSDEELARRREWVERVRREVAAKLRRGANHGGGDAA